MKLPFALRKPEESLHTLYSRDTLLIRGIECFDAALNFTRMPFSSIGIFGGVFCEYLDRGFGEIRRPRSRFSLDQDSPLA